VCAISSKFGLRGQGAATRHHNGVDIPAPKGTPVLATADGYVMFSGRADSYGRAIRIAHADGIETCYAHLRKCIAKKGKPVTQGQIVGKVGRSGRADGYHLHYEVRVYGNPVDPARFLPPKVEPETPGQE
jgi:murein DD-endopeptidase MepM/ murein hydrolase activator NlpD